MTSSIQFFECPNCGKSLRVNAHRCHHCDAQHDNDWADPDAAEEFATGGYLSDEDEDVPQADAPWKRNLVVVVVSLLLLSFVLQVILF